MLIDRFRWLVYWHAVMTVAVVVSLILEYYGSALVFSFFVLVSGWTIRRVEKDLLVKGVAAA